MDTIICIPARLQSTRLNEKLLITIDGEEMIKKTYSNAEKTGIPVYITTDSEKIGCLFPKNKVIYEDATWCRSPINGTERICRSLSQLPDCKYVCMLQGDECYFKAAGILETINYIRSLNADTLVTRYKKVSLGTRSSGIRLVLNSRFKRILDGVRTDVVTQKFSAIRTGPVVIHRKTLEKYNRLSDTPNQIERDIEWLKWIEHGYKISVFECPEEYCGKTSINTPDDLSIQL